MKNAKATKRKRGRLLCCTDWLGRPNVTDEFIEVYGLPASWPIALHTTGKIQPKPSSQQAAMSKRTAANHRQLARAVQRAIWRMCEPQRLDPKERRMSPHQIMATALPLPIADKLYQWLIEEKARGQLGAPYGCGPNQVKTLPELFFGVRLDGTLIRAAQLPVRKRHYSSKRSFRPNDRGQAQTPGATVPDRKNV
jgi:hypothetical protein